MKTPRLRFFGVECTVQQFFALRSAAGYSYDIQHGCSRPFGDGFKRAFKPGGLFVVGDSLKCHVQELVDKGLVRYDRKVKHNVWTLLGVRFTACVARNNRHIHTSTREHDNRLWKKEKKKNGTQDHHRH